MSVLTATARAGLKPEPAKATGHSSLTERVIESYRPDGPFMVLRADELRRIYKAYRLNPRTTEPAIFAVESLAHVLQGGVLALFDAPRLTRQRGPQRWQGTNAVALRQAVGCRILGVDLSPFKSPTHERWRPSMEWSTWWSTLSKTQVPWI